MSHIIDLPHYAWMEDKRLAETRAKLRPNLTCPTCKTPRALTRAEARKGYQCHNCADLEEFGV